MFTYSKEKGVSLVIVFFVMIIIVAVVLSVTSFLYTSIRLVRNMSNSVASFYAADSGIEKVLYYDRRLPPTENGRGLCLMCDASNASCPADDPEPGLNCACQPSVYGSNPNGCDPDVCDDCTVSFTGGFDGASYSIQATVFPGQDPYDMEIRSSGSYNGIGRAIDVLTGGGSDDVQ